MSKPKRKHAGPKPFTVDGIPVRDATKPLLLQITDDDIRRGKPMSHDACAAAIAGVRQTGCVKAKVWRHMMLLLPPPKRGQKQVWERYVQSQPLRTETKAFDKGGRMEADTYVCRPPLPSTRPTGKRQGSNAPGARDRGSKDRTPSRKRMSHDYRVRPIGPHVAT